VGKVMIMGFWDIQSVLLFKDNKVSSVLGDVEEVNIRQKRTSLQDVILHHDNALLHTAEPLPLQLLRNNGLFFQTQLTVLIWNHLNFTCLVR